jgi:tRNA nucleotidyltransferase (CCA-adding enzyme)
MSGGRWEHFPHEADIGVRGVGPSLADAFRQVAIALTAAITDPDSVAATTPVAIAASADDAEDLLYDWLNALVFEMATRGMLFSRFDVEIDGGRLTATAWGEAVSVERHRPAVEVKGATYTGLRVFEADNGGWIAECVIDV